MANYIEKTNFRSNRFVPISSRYNGSSVIYYSENKFITFDTYKKQEYTPNSGDQYWVITPGTEYRPDLVSYNAYGTVDFWWRIMEANGLKDILEFKSGLNIVIPNSIYR
jgi:hypothetical protein